MNVSVDPNMSKQSGQNQSTMERMERNKYKIPILSDRETDLTKFNPRMWWEQISEYIDLTCHKYLEDLMDQRIETLDANTVNLPELLKLFMKTFRPIRNAFYSRATQFFKVKPEEDEALNEYWKRLVDIKRKRAFNQTTPKEFITYKIFATINDKKAQDKFTKGPLELRTVLENIELDN